VSSAVVRLSCVWACRPRKACTPSGSHWGPAPAGHAARRGTAHLLANGDEIIFIGCCTREGYVPIGFGGCTGTIVETEG